MSEDSGERRGTKITRRALLYGAGLAAIGAARKAGLLGSPESPPPPPNPDQIRRGSNEHLTTKPKSTESSPQPLVPKSTSQENNN